MSYIPASRRAWSRLDDYRGPRPLPSERLISVTSLLNPPRIVRLTALHRDEIPPPVPGEDTWSLLGTAVHAALQKAAESMAIERTIRAIDDPEALPAPILVEHRCETQVFGWTVSGQCDLLEADGVLWDWKVTSAWSVSMGGKTEWEAQLNVLRWLLERSGAVPRGTIRGLSVWAISRDWSEKQAQRDPGYPQAQECAIPCRLWTEEECYSYVTGRLALHEAARTVLPECTPEERWARDAGFAVLKSPKAPRADRIFERREDAERYLREILNNKGIVEERPGTSNRCARYCKVNFACDFYQKSLDRR